MRPVVVQCTMEFIMTPYPAGKWESQDEFEEYVLEVGTKALEKVAKKKGYTLGEVITEVQ